MKEYRQLIRNNFISFLLFPIGFTQALLVFYPGSLSADSWDQFNQAISKNYFDWHPPVMAWLWSHLLWLKPGPQPMLLLHLFLFWGGLFLVWKKLAEDNSWTKVLVPLIGLWPPIIAMVGVIWKDIGLGCSLVMVIGLLVEIEKHTKPRLVVIALLLTYASWLRHNSVALTGPFIVFLPYFLNSFSLIPSTHKKRTFQLALGFLLLAGTIVANNLWEKYILKTKPTYPISLLNLLDLSLIEEETGQEFIPLEFRTQHYSKQKIHNAIHDRSTGGLIFNYDSPYKIPRQSLINARLKDIWISEILNHPRPYLVHRWFHFRSVMRMGFGQCYANHFYMPEKFGGGIAWMQSWRNYLGEQTTHWAAVTPIFSGWFYMLLSACFLLISVWLRSNFNLIARLCFISTLAYSLSYFPSSVSCDFRYSWPMIPVTFLGISLLFKGVNRLSIFKGRGGGRITPL